MRELKISYEEAGRLLQFYEDGLQGYTYLEDPKERTSGPGSGIRGPGSGQGLGTGEFCATQYVSNARVSSAAIISALRVSIWLRSII